MYEKLRIVVFFRSTGSSRTTLKKTNDMAPMVCLYAIPCPVPCYYICFFIYTQQISCTFTQRYENSCCCCCCCLACNGHTHTTQKNTHSHAQTCESSFLFVVIIDGVCVTIVDEDDDVVVVVATAVAFNLVYVFRRVPLFFIPPKLLHISPYCSTFTMVHVCKTHVQTPYELEHISWRSICNL